jgi:hypothetical protein
MRGSFVIAAFVLLGSSVVGTRAQQLPRPPVEGGLTEYLGQPRQWQRHLGMGAGFIFDKDGASLLAEGRMGVYTDLVNPVFGFLGFQGEIYFGARSTSFDYGLRTQIVSPYLHFAAGFDINGLDRKPYVLLSAFHPWRRGGIVGSGSMLRLNYLPGRENSFSLGVEFPVGRRINMGSTRPREASVPMDVPRTPPADYATPEPDLIAALARMGESAYWITRVTVPFLEQGIFGSEGATALDRELRELKSYLQSQSGEAAWTADDEVRRFHDAMDRAFSFASGSGPLGPGECTELGKLVAENARRVLLAEVIFPYDRLLGQVKRPDSLAGLGVRGRGMFIRWLHMEPRIPAERIAANLWVFTKLMGILESARSFQHQRWNDSRFVWLPLQFALRPEQHDSQRELDALIERVTGEEFTEGNRVWYVLNEQFPLQLSRTIHAAEEYHVLWVHDIRGYDDSGNPDEMTYRHVLGAYLGALIERVRAYDRTGTFPVYMIFLDEFYYEVNHSRFWLELLEDPLGHKLELPAGFEAWQDTIAAAQEALRQAVSQSRLLQDQAAQFGGNWLRNLVRVHVSITNPADPSFGAAGVMPIFGLPDNVIRDHRKIAFFDITEDDPYRGGAIYSGSGVGEHYTTLSWEDRSLVVEGPVLLTLKKQARQLLLDHGIEAERIPWALQPRPFAPGYDDRIRAQADTGFMNVRALDIHNQTGYSPKDLSVVKAVLYTMMPAGSVAIVPDALWNAGFWGGLLLGHSLRGGRSLIIAPATANAPSTRMGGTVRLWEVLSRIVQANTALHEEIEERGGLLKLGVYSPSFQTTDIHAKLDALRQTLLQHAWFRQLYNLRPEVHAALDSLSIELRGQNERWQRLLSIEDEGASKLHLKANFLASREAWNGLLRLPAWPEVVRVFAAKRVWQIENRDWALGHLESPVPDVIDVGQPVMDRWLSELSPDQKERLVIYLLLGSSNQNYRSMVFDGEAALLVSGTSINAGLIDLVALTGQCHWVEDTKELAAFYPKEGWLMLLLAHRLRLIL